MNFMWHKIKKGCGSDRKDDLRIRGAMDIELYLINSGITRNYGILCYSESNKWTTAGINLNLE